MVTKYSGSEFCIIHRGDVATDGVSSQNFRQLSAEMRLNGLLGSAKSGHIEPNDRSTAKILTMVIKGGMPVLNSV